jgi:predicted deacetylase
MKSLVVSLHDVSPLTQPLCEEILSSLFELGARQTSLLVIPNHHGRAPVAENKAFQSWLREKVDAGHEPVLHGYFHRRQKRKADSWLSRLTTEVYTAGEGEFYDLTFDLAAKLLCHGLSDLGFLPRKPVGFVAPAWLLSDAAEHAVQSADFLYTARIGYIRIFKLSQQLKSRSLVWSTRVAWRTVSSLYWNKILQLATNDAPVVRVSIHPGDARQPAIWRQISQIIAAMLRTRECLTYERLVQRLIAGSSVREKS